MAGSWALLSHQPPASVDTMLLLTDGTVVAHQSNSPNWYRLTPTSTGSYDAGIWSSIAPMPPNPAIAPVNNGPTYGPLFFGSAVLKDGTMLVIGGEYNVGKSCDLAAATHYDPVANSWTNLTTPSGWANVGDVPLCVMPNGQVMLGNINSDQTVFFDPPTKTYIAGPNKSDRCAEESFTLMSDGTVVVVDCTAIPTAEKYVPSTNTWVSAGSTPSTLPQACAGIVPEIGPSVLLPSGHLFVIGATGNTALYTPPAIPSQPGTWSAGPSLKNANGATIYPIDAPAALLPNGKVLLAGSPGPPCGFPGPTVFFEYNPATNTVALVPVPANSAGACFTGRMVLTGSGKVLFSNQSGTVSIYTPDLAPLNAWRPVITACPTALQAGHSYVISGQQFNGLSQACSYGDDATMATNYPLVQLTNHTTGAVSYCRTANHSTMAVATGTTTVSTNFTVPSGLTTGSYTLVVIANGIPSLGYGVSIVTIKKIEIKEVKESKIEIKEIKEKEIKEIKEGKIEIKEIKEKEKEKEIKEIKESKLEIKELEHKLVENKLKDAEGPGPGPQPGPADPALAGALQEINSRIDALEATVQQQRATITAEERPDVGEAALQHSTKKLTKEDKPKKARE
jgi:hypothetical protein